MDKTLVIHHFDPLHSDPDVHYAKKIDARECALPALK